MTIVSTWAPPEVTDLIMSSSYPASFQEKKPFSDESAKDPEPVKNEIEIFTRRYIPLPFFLISVANIGLVAFKLANMNSRCFYRIHAENLIVTLMVIFLAMVHFFYTSIMVAAPRFLYRGLSWLKALPWIVSSASLFATFLLLDEHPIWVWVACSAAFLIQLVQFIVCVIKKETAISFLFKPFEKVLVQSLLAKIDFKNPNSGLDSFFGPPIVIKSVIPGQAPSIVRYGTQAAATIGKPNTDNSIININEEQFASEKPAFAPADFPMPPPQSQQDELPAYQPPEYSPSTEPTDQNNTNFPEKFQFDLKK